jgi:hypothetical protein
MQLSQTTSIAASLALLFLPFSIHAQSESSKYNSPVHYPKFQTNTSFPSQNITLRFFPASQPDTCDYTNSTGALTFTTSSIPVISHCFDFSTLFGGNTTQGFVNQTRNQGTNVWGEAGIHWQLSNLATFDAQANYSRVLYRQHIASPTDDDQKPGHHADRRVTLYGARDCRESDDGNSETLLPWYGFDCWSEDQGSCGTLPYGIASFSVQPEQEEQKGTCWVFAERGAATRVWGGDRAVLGGFVSAFVAVWLAL